MGGDLPAQQNECPAPHSDHGVRRMAGADAVHVHRDVMSRTRWRKSATTREPHTAGPGKGGCRHTLGNAAAALQDDPIPIGMMTRYLDCLHMGFRLLAGQDGSHHWKQHAGVESNHAVQPKPGPGIAAQGTRKPSAAFHKDQDKAIQHIVEGSGPLLVVQKTGWGKSNVYFIATKLLREQGSGPALLVSPLLALMRNQIEAARRMGVGAETINSSNRQEWDEVVHRTERDEVDILLISPERLANEAFRERVLLPIAGRIALLVVDEAHCISDWGHDFRPDYRRIERLVQLFPPNLRLLATTATANRRVMADLQQTLGAGLCVLHGDLSRPSLTLQTVVMPRSVQRMAWLAEQLPNMPGSGIVYTLTIRDAHRLAAWLTSQPLNVAAYTGDMDNLERQGLEEALLSNQVKALVATVALGMGYDKPDLGFVIHYQAPGSPSCRITSRWGVRDATATPPTAFCSAAKKRLKLRISSSTAPSRPGMKYARSLRRWKGNRRGCPCPNWTERST